MQREIDYRLQKFFRRFKKSQFKKGEIIIRAGDTPPGIFYLLKGNVRMYSVSEDGAELTLNIYKPGSYFSLIWAIAKIPNTYFFEAITPVEVYLAAKDEVIKFIKTQPNLLFDVTRRAFVGLYGLSTRMESLVFGSAYEKIAATLVVSTWRFGKKDSQNVFVPLPLTHNDIAILSGTTRETASRQLKKLERKGLIERKKRNFVIKDLPALTKEALLTP